MTGAIASWTLSTKYAGRILPHYSLCITNILAKKAKGWNGARNVDLL